MYQMHVALNCLCVKKLYIDYRYYLYNIIQNLHYYLDADVFRYHH